MCLAIPMRVITLNGDNATVELNGIQQTISVVAIKDIKLGDYVVVHAGFAIQKLDPEAALETLEILKDLETALQS